MIGRILALVLGAVVGLAGSQAPEFAQQYRQRIGGAIDELRRVVARFDESAQQSGLSRAQAIDRLAQQPEPVAQRQAPAMTEIVDRLDRLEIQRDAVATAAPFERLVVLARGFDGQLARATYLDYEPAWPATSEGLVIGGAGFVLGWGILRLVFGRLGRLGRRRRTAPDGLRAA